MMNNIITYISLTRASDIPTHADPLTYRLVEHAVRLQGHTRARLPHHAASSTEVPHPQVDLLGGVGSCIRGRYVLG